MGDHCRSEARQGSRKAEQDAKGEVHVCLVPASRRQDAKAPSTLRVGLLAVAVLWIWRRDWAARKAVSRPGNRMGLEEGQGSMWPSSRKPHRCLKGAKRAKGANVLVTVVTDMALLTYTVHSATAPVLGSGKVASAAKKHAPEKLRVSDHWPRATMLWLGGFLAPVPGCAALDWPGLNLQTPARRQKAVAPPPTKVGHDPQLSNAVNGTVVATPGVTRRT